VCARRFGGELAMVEMDGARGPGGSLRDRANVADLPGKRRGNSLKYSNQICNFMIPALFCFFFGWLCVSAEAAASGLVWEKDRQDLPPPAASAKQVEAHFKFQNAGTKNVQITAIKASCGCVTAASEKDTFAPGEVGEVVVTFAYGDRTGQQEKAVAVQTSDPNQPVKVLTLRVNLPRLLEIQPALVMWRIGEKPEAKQMDIKVQAGAIIGELTATSSSPDVAVRLEKGKSEGTYSLMVTPKETTHPLSAFIRLQTGDGDSRVFLAQVRVK
jgi:hypothetical protein